jgi:acetyl-CoA C-acetyltransferase
MPHTTTPVLIGGGQFTQRTAREGRIAESLNPIAMLEKAARLALADTGRTQELISSIDTVSVVRFTADSSDVGRLPRRMFRNPPRSLAKRLAASPRRAIYTAAGGNTPQWLVNQTADDIAGGKCEAALLVGAEYIATMLAAIKQGITLDWGAGEDGDPGADPEEIGEMRPGSNAYERAYSLNFPVNTYPLFENAIRGAKGRDIATHLRALGELFSPFSKVAAKNPHAWFPIYRTPEEISTPSERNRFVGFPYTKYMNAVIEVDMAAAIVMTSVAKARELGIPESKWVYLHGCADVAEIWNVSERVNYFTSPAIRMLGKKVCAMANVGIADASFIDLYSCFPSAVELACRELGISEDDPRGLTIAGGLPYFGGAGNDYVMHSIVTMMEKLRAHPGRYGLCTGNGWYVTKHSAGIYSTKPVEDRWQREDPKTYQNEIDSEAHPKVVENAEGRATVETYTVVQNRKGGRFGIVVGRLEDGRRFLANTPDDDATLDRMMREEMLGRAGTVSVTPHNNLFRFD